MGSLALSTDEQLTKVINIVEEFIINKKGEEFENEMKRVKDRAEEKHGNDIMYKVFLVRDLAKLFKNKPQRILFIDTEDEKIFGPEITQPNIFITRKNVLGEGEHEEIVMMNVRIGDKIVFKDVSLPEAFAGLIQLIFCLNLQFPDDADDICQFVQRIICNFGTKDGARNKKNDVKKNYRAFEVG